MTLTVSENGLFSSDQLNIIVRAGRPPFAFAGADHVVQLDDSIVDLNLDGSSSMSYNTATPNFSWSGPLSFENSSQSSPVAVIRIKPEDFSDRTLLRFKLEVSDEVGLDSDDVSVAVYRRLDHRILLWINS